MSMAAVLDPGGGRHARKSAPNDGNASSAGSRACSSSLFRAIGVPPDDALPDPAYPTIAHSATLGTEMEATHGASRGVHFW